MAPKATNRSLRQQTDRVTDAVSDFATDALLATGRLTAPGAGRSGRLLDLVELCGVAADYLAHANKLLATRPVKAEDAIAALDAALVCLQDVSSKSAGQRQAAVRERARSA